MTPELAAGWSALVAAAATVAGMIALLLLCLRLVGGTLTIPTWNA